MLNCPLCRSEFTIPSEGIDGFKTDFHMKCIIEFIELRKSLQEEQTRECYDCMETLRVTAYCFKCTDFLCKGCHDNHTTNNTLKDHRPHVFTLSGNAARNLTLEELASLHENQRCEIHPENLARLCCRTCGNHPICVTCTYGTHENHNVKDVNMLATREREKLKEDVTMISQNKEKLDQIKERAEKIRQELTLNINKTKENFQLEHDRKIETITKELKNLNENICTRRSKIERKRRRDLMMAKKDMEQKIKDIKEKYSKVCNDIKEESSTKLDELKLEQEKENKISHEQIYRLETELKAFNAVAEKKETERLAKIIEIRDKVDDTNERLKNLETTCLSITKTANDWIALHCIPDICRAVEELGAEMKNTYPELETLSKIQIKAKISFDDEPSFDFKHIRLKTRHLDSIASSGDGTIVITGGVSEKNQSHLTACNMKGQVLREDTLRSSAYSSDCYCAFLSPFKVAMASWHNEIGLYDVRSGSYVKMKISDVIGSWPKDSLVSCVAVDSVRRHILVGRYNSECLYVFDDQLNYHHTVSLPNKIKYPIDLCVIEDNLVLCDKFNANAYLVSLEGLEGKLVLELKKPVFNEADWRPISVCSSKKGVFFVLWATGVDFTYGRRALVQYSRDGGELSTTMEVISNARCITSVPMDQVEKLLVATYDSGKVFSYSINYM